MIYQEYEQESRLLVQKALKTMLARIPKQYDDEYLEYQKDLKLKHLLQINLIAQAAYAFYSIADWYVIADVGMLAITTKLLYTAIISVITLYLFKYNRKVELFDLILPCSIIGASALWFYLVNLSASPNVTIYIYSSLVFVLLANLSIQVRFLPALIVSFTITIIGFVGVYYAIDGAFEQFVLYLLSYMPILVFSLVMSWVSTYKSRSIFLHHKLDSFNRQTLEMMAHTDMLTGIDNRRYFERRAKKTISDHANNEQPISLLMLDIDHFKAINDTYGHDVGDEVLKKMSDVCKTVLRSNDLFARYGGEEFIALLPHTPQENAYLIAERLRQKIEKSPIIVQGYGPIYFTASIGVTLIDYDKYTFNDAIKQADIALYVAKSAGRNLVMKAS
ncbi:GGDEF domain-containing protein [Acinetobacter faecalis]|uniref:GGDEF domain-containing protein n=1 Tax=Acinetobacter faecalis TaxID=2665161 RepID=UPI002A914A8E|nr:GGDEF domain-containing protein [Acinetobacter faecalis]MDY6451289.1 GGDEF domain-containing protein [Acinetobacter faecalis]MDY6482924.1 GGDEF domain-containing protein [Acinetobacter faecalis]